MAELTINEALGWLKTLRTRHQELVSLRDQNSHRTTRYRGMGGDKEDKIEPTYDVKELDKMVTRVARDIRLCEQAIKSTNAVTKVIGYQQDDAVLGEL